MNIIENIVIWIITGVLGALASFFAMKYRSVKKKDNALENGLQCLLRGEIIKTHDKYTEKGYCPIIIKESVTKSYEAYHELGGNGVVTKLYNDIMGLPEEPQNN